MIGQYGGHTYHVLVVPRPPNIYMTTGAIICLREDFVWCSRFLVVSENGRLAVETVRDGSARVLVYI